MVDPIINAVEVWLTFFENLPQPVVALFNLVLLLMCIFYVIQLVEKAGN